MRLAAGLDECEKRLARATSKLPLGRDCDSDLAGPLAALG
jgi:hypothetical protein